MNREADLRHLRHPMVDPRGVRKIIGAFLATPISVRPRAQDGLLYFDLTWRATYNFDAITATTRQVGQEVTGRVTRPTKARTNRRVQKALKWCPRGDSNTRHAV
jgi:hypothetical protein